MWLTENALGAGDQSGNLMWRLETGGEFPTIHMPKTVVILIGTNDLTYADCHDDQQDILNAAPGIISRHVPLSSPQRPDMKYLESPSRYNLLTHVNERCT